MRSPSAPRRPYRPRSLKPARFRRTLAVLLGAAAAALAAGGWEATLGPPTAEAAKPIRFGLCPRGGGSNCVVDGDSFWIGGEKVRVADIGAPETHPPRCRKEARLGDAATRRLQALLNEGPVTLVTESRDTDRYGRKLRVVERDGESLGAQLVAEGLARPWEGRRRPWC